MRRELIIILLLTFINVLNFAILIPVLPFIVKSYGGGSVLYGVLLSMYPLFQFFAAPILGAWSDMVGRRKVLLLSQAGTLLSWVIFGIAYFIPEIYIGPVALPLAVIMLSRITDGATGGNNSVANAYLTDITKPEDRSKTFGMLGGAFGVGLLLGPAIGGYTSSFGIGFLGVAITNVILSSITLILMYLFLPETLQKKERDKSLHFKFSDEIKFIPKLMKYLENRTIKYLFSMRISFLIIFSAYTSIIVLFIIDAFGLTEKEIGLLFLAIGSFLIFNQVFMAGFFSKRIGDLRTFILGQGIFIISLIVMQFVPNLILYIVISYVMNLGFSISFPTFKSLLSNTVDQSKQGEVQGIDESLMAAASAIAPITAGLLYAWIGRYSFGVFAVALIIPYVYFVLKFKKKSS